MKEKIFFGICTVLATSIVFTNVFIFSFHCAIILLMIVRIADRKERQSLQSSVQKPTETYGLLTEKITFAKSLYFQGFEGIVKNLT